MRHLQLNTIWMGIVFMLTECGQVFFKLQGNHTVLNISLNSHPPSCCYPFLSSYHINLQGIRFKNYDSTGSKTVSRRNPNVLNWLVNNPWRRGFLHQFTHDAWWVLPTTWMYLINAIQCHVWMIVKRKCSCNCKGSIFRGQAPVRVFSHRHAKAIHIICSRKENYKC